MMARPALAFVFAAIASLGLLSPALARDVTDGEKAQLAATVADFGTAMRTNDFERIVDIVPPKMFERLAADNHLTVEQLRAAAIEQTKQTMTQVTFVSFGMDTAKASYAAATDDTPYALIPTETVMLVGKDKVKAAGDTLALLEAGKWYLVRVSETAQAELLKQVYPAFADVQFTLGTMETVTQ